MINNKIMTINILFKYFNLIFGLLFFNGFGNRVSHGFFINYTENSEFIQSNIGHNITLECNLRGLLSNFKTADVIYRWYFKQCGEGSGAILNCYERNDNEDWTQLPCENNNCKSKLNLKYLTEKYSGLYKCTIIPRNGNILDVKLVRIFQLVVPTSSFNIPEFLDAHPLNKTITSGSQVTFECSVYSKEYPTIKWFRRLSKLKYSNYENIHSIVYYNDQAYELLISTREKTASKNVYLSKLIINNVNIENEGYYACVAISFHGHNIRETYLKVYADNDDEFAEYWSDYEEENELLPAHYNQFWLLFLMPIGLALLPLSVWLCYIIDKRYQDYKLKDESKYMEGYEKESMLKTFL